MLMLTFLKEKREKDDLAKKTQSKMAFFSRNPVPASSPSKTSGDGHRPNTGDEQVLQLPANDAPCGQQIWSCWAVGRHIKREE